LLLWLGEPHVIECFICDILFGIFIF
jgi:hypothetical protein